MSKICANCGNEMSDESMFCMNCGTPVAAEPVAEPAAPVRKTGKKFDVSKLLAAFKENPKLRLAAIAAAAVIALVLIIVIISACANPWKSGMTNYINLAYKGKAGAMVKAAPNEVWEYIDDEYGISKDDIKKDSKDYAEEISEDLEDTYGKNVKYTYKVVKQKKMTKKMVEDLGEILEENYDIDSDIVKAGYIVQLEYEVSGKDYFHWDEGMFMFVKIKGSWYRISESGTLMGLSKIMATETFMEESSNNEG